MPSIGIVFITHCAKHHLKKCLPPLLNSPLNPRVLVVNSSSNDGTVELAQELGAETLVIPRSEFNHGLTREKARKHLNTDIVVMMTPDAYATDTGMLGRLVNPLITKKASIAYARQLPHDGADFFETFAREFNYPSEGHIRSIRDVSKYGIYTIFCSDSCAGYLNAALDEIGGFIDVLTGEDTVAAAKLLHRGHKIAYVAEACVKHSHKYTLKQEFKRHFDTGLARESYKSMIDIGATDQARGKLYLKTLMIKLWKERPLLIPYACVQTITKWFGYKIGTKSVNASTAWKKMCSSQDFYWK